MAENKKRICHTIQKSKLADGTPKEYRAKVSYEVKGYIHENGKVYQITEEQMKEMKERSKNGVTKSRLAQDYNLSYTTTLKYLKE